MIGNLYQITLIVILVELVYMQELLQVDIHPLQPLSICQKV